MSQYDDEAVLGDCFKVAANLVVPMLGLQKESVSNLDSLTLVHGIVSGQGPLEGLRYTHAWVEGVSQEGVPLVVDASNGREVVIPAALYYLIGQIDPEECVRYTPEAASQRMLQFAHYGPWDGAPAGHTNPRMEDVKRSATQKAVA